jgi:hypothetical protein
MQWREGRVCVGKGGRGEQGSEWGWGKARKGGGIDGCRKRGNKRGEEQVTLTHGPALDPLQELLLKPLPQVEGHPLGGDRPRLHAPAEELGVLRILGETGHREAWGVGVCVGGKEGGGGSRVEGVACTGRSTSTLLRLPLPRSLPHLLSSPRLLSTLKPTIHPLTPHPSFCLTVVPPAQKL